MKLNRKQFCALFRAEFYVASVMFEYDPVRAGIQHRTSAPKLYSYKVPLELKLEVGDYVYVPDVDSGDVTRPNLKRAQVGNIIKDTDAFNDSGVSFKWIVGKESDILAQYQDSLAKDVNILKAVNKLERAMDRVELQAQMKLALELLSPTEREELTGSLGLDLSKLNLLSSESK